MGMDSKDKCAKANHKWIGIQAVVTKDLEYKVIEGELWMCEKCRTLVKKIPKKI